MTERVECECGRPRATAEDLERWKVETQVTLWWAAPDAIASARDHYGNSVWTEQADPGWSRALCWTIPRTGRQCGMRRRWASDRYIGEARNYFERWVANNSVVLP